MTWTHRLSFFFVAGLLLAGCSDDVNCVEEPDDPDCVASCEDNPTLPGCTDNDLGPGDGGPIDGGGRDMPDPDAGVCGACGGGTPVCDESTGACVACLTGADCTGSEAPECLVDTEDSANNACVGCVDEGDCGGDTPFCSDANTCVGCTADADCTDPANAKCGTDFTCGPCDDSAQCAGTGENVCATGTCVECTAGDERACGTNVCDVEAQTCTSTPAGSNGLCQECVSDRQCQDGQVCAPMTFMDADVGSYCLWRETSGEVLGPDGTCAATFRPYVAASEVTTVSGETVRVCGLAVTTCAALNDYRVDGSCDTAGMNDPCGAPGQDDGLCRDDPSGELGTRCTIPCLSNEDCRGLTCLTTQTPAFCDF